MTTFSKIFRAKIPNEKQDFGEIDIEIEGKLNALDNELIKRGTLSADTIDWIAVKTLCSEILPQASHLLAFRGLILALCADGNTKNVEDAIDIFAFVLSGHYPNMHPKDAKFARRRQAWTNEMASTIAASLNDLGMQVPTIIKAKSKELDLIVAQLEKNKLDKKPIEAVLTQPPTNATSASQDIKPSGDNINNQIAQNSEQPATSNNQILDAKGRAQLKRDIIALANRIFAHDPNAEISYSMRGFAAWLEFQFLPEANEQGITQYQTMPRPIVDEFQSQLASPSLSTLMRLEERLLSSPDWFEGQKLAAEMADKLNLKKATAAIQLRCFKRLSEWPALKALKYSNESPFVAAEVEKWLALSKSTTSIADPSNELNAEVEELESFMEEINQTLSQARSLREKSVVKLRLAKALRDKRWSDHANMMLLELRETLRKSTASDWDSYLLQEIESLIKQ